MGYIKEPPGVDFFIKSKPLTPEEQIEVSAYIQAYKKKMAEEEAAKKKGRKKKLIETN